MNKQLKDFTLIELKSIGYDELMKIQEHQNNLNIINQELQSRVVLNQNKNNMEENTNVEVPVESKENTPESITPEVVNETV